MLSKHIYSFDKYHVPVTYEAHVLGPGREDCEPDRQV